MKKIVTIDCQYVYPRFAAAFLMVDGDQAAFVENNTVHAVPFLMKALEKEGLKPEQVRYVIVTHVHLDHAGGSSRLMELCPQAQLIAHPRAAPHLIDPSKLIAGAKQVYGEPVFQKLYGTISPIAASRVQRMEDGEELAFGSEKLRFIHTRGHANHHFCIFDPVSRGIFTGDSFGISYPELRTEKGFFIFPSTSPTDFNPEEARISVRKILESGAEKAYLTHFGELQNLQEAADQLLALIDLSEGLVFEGIRAGWGAGEAQQLCEKALRGFFERVLTKLNLMEKPDIWGLLKMDLELNAAGITHLIQKSLKQKGQIKSPT